MKKLLLFGLFVVLSFVSVAQELSIDTIKNTTSKEDSLFFSLIYLKSGDVFIGQITETNDTSLLVTEKNLGKMVLPIKEVNKTEHIFHNDKIQLHLLDNSKYTGKLITTEDDYFVLEIQHSGIVKIPIASVTKILNLKGDKIRPHNPNSSRYFFAPSAIPLEKHTGYYQNVYLLYNSVSFGLTHNFTLGGGVVIPLLFFITPKVGYKIRDNFYLGAGLIAGTTLLPGAIISGGIPFGVATFGNEENNFTVGGGYGLIWEEGNFEQTHYPITTINGMLRVSKRIQLVSENWIVPFQRQVEIEYDDPNGNTIETQTGRTETKLYMALSLGMRILINSKSSVDFTPIYLYNNGDNGVVIPYLDFVYKF